MGRTDPLRPGSPVDYRKNGLEVTHSFLFLVAMPFVTSCDSLIFVEQALYILY